MIFFEVCAVLRAYRDVEHVHGWTADGPGEATRGRTRRKRTGKICEGKLLIYMFIIEILCMYRSVLSLHKLYYFGRFLPFSFVCMVDCICA